MKVPEKGFVLMGFDNQNQIGLYSSQKSKKNPKTDERLSIKSIVNKRRMTFMRKSGVFNYVEAAAGELVPNTVKTAEDIEIILKALNSHFIFTNLTDEDKEVVANAMQLYTFLPNTYVFMQNMPSKSYYVIKTGAIEVIVNGKRVNKIHDGEGFGELALLDDNPRSASLKCVEPTTLWGLDKNIFRSVIQEMNTQIYEENRLFLEKVPLLETLNNKQKDILATSLVSVKYYTGQKIISEGETGNQLYFVKEGVVSVLKGAQEIKRIYPGEYFGENALINNVPRTATCIALEGLVKCMCLSRDTLQKVLNNKLQDIIEKNTILEAIKKSSMFYMLSKSQKESLQKIITEKKYKAGDVVISSGTPCSSKIYIIISGRLQYATNSLIVCDKGTLLGDAYVASSENTDAKYHDDLIAGSDMKVGEITRYQFEMAIGGRFQDVVKENAASNVLRKIFIFSGIEVYNIKYLLQMISIEKFVHTKIIINEGVPNSSVYAVKTGKVDVFKAGNLIKTIYKLGYFGERILVTDENSIHTYVANGKVTLWSIKISELSKILNDKMKKLLRSRIEMEDENTDLKDFKVLRKIGRGILSRVYLLKSKKNILYALKTVSRKKIHKLGISQQLLVKFI
jgi:cGMP-dependent protein kinase 1